ncbi:hypothetical protein ADL15_45970 [Actinoplanes awajinensis subsp. mycoplanecinus]|uniref:Uncharacterized protein n=1 Tax=Actinoplanes awajinensis subsp. mycoplanecinus TaxID=135947 RepID=A0A101JB45_9ACTN|nr:hypothetical protein ADL15_45970 [Actinoplanes awajinensis subsp. mycoplanecinus]
MGRVAGRVHAGPVIGRVPPLERARTDVAPLDGMPPPVFADPSGVRRRRLRRLSYAVAVLLVVLAVGFWLSQLLGGAPGSGGLFR